ncbi:MAG: ATPase, T2SS/T4P/T4SS family [Legionella sp.]|uniref:ATPase, T2SS/T4P/T4SS family n=1 Tax=Legionella sp. TaxID=459 RepID=UPI0028414ED9|nr:ATPase, T2SS/T4P/T4SS family [Legionella sp.]
MSVHSEGSVTPPEESPPEITLQSLLEVIQQAPDIRSIKRTLYKQILDVFQVEMAAIFLVDIRKQELVSWILLPGDSLEKIVTPIGTNSIIGYVALKKQPVNLRNPYDFRELRRIDSELNFSDSYDKKVNIRSKQILAIPIVHNNTLMGVFELINKRNDTDFTYQDQNKVNEFAGVLAAAFFTYSIFGKQTPPKYESLLAQKLLSRKELEQGLAKATELGEDPETVLMNNFQIPRLKMGKLLAHFYSTSFVDLEKVDNIPKKLIQRKNIDYFEKEELVPLSLNDEKLIVAVKNIEDQTLTSTIREQVSGVNQVELVFAFQGDIRSFWKRTRARYFSSSNGVSEERLPSFDTSLFDLLEANKPQEKVKEKRVTVVERRVKPEKCEENNDDINEPPVVQLVNEIIEGGYSSQTSDIHIEPYGLEENGEVRYRIDGVCSNALKIPQQYVRQVIDRIKSLASLKRAERTRPQDGKIKFTTSEGKEIELRVATIPTVNSNEDIVLRILPTSKPLPLLDKLMPSRLLAPFKEIIEQEQGIILVVGPNASGKTTTLHSVLNHLNTPEKKIWTAEYPLEIKQYRIRQVQVDPLMNYTFADALRVFLRADPDVIMIGDMQDLQTAVIAIDAALNGHLLLSSLPANSAAEGIIHCLNIGLDPLHLAAALHGVLAQRLVRTLCEHCKEPYHPERAEYDRLFESYGISFFDHINVMYSDDLVFHRANGCHICNDSGYHGRTGLFELLVVNPIIRKLIMKRAPLSEILEEAMINDMTLLLQEGIQLVFKGTIDSKELMSVCPL